MKSDPTRLLVVVIASLAASTWSHWAYRSLIVPRLPTVKSVPLVWWLGADLPFILVVVVAGLLSTSLAKVPLYSLAVLGPSTLAQTVRSALTGAPFAHDVWVGDAAFWATLVFQFVVCTVVVGVGYGGARVLKTRRLGA